MHTPHHHMHIHAHTPQTLGVAGLVRPQCSWCYRFWAGGGWVAGGCLHCWVVCLHMPRRQLSSQYHSSVTDHTAIRDVRDAAMPNFSSINTRVVRRQFSFVRVLISPFLTSSSDSIILYLTACRYSRRRASLEINSFVSRLGLCSCWRID